MSQTIIPVRGYHLDGYGHVNHARYLEFLEEARWAYFERHHLLPLLGKKIQIVVTHIDIRYRRSATFGETLYIDTQIDQLESRRVIVKQTIHFNDNGKTVSEALITLVPVSGGQSVDLPEALWEKLESLRQS